MQRNQMVNGHQHNLNLTGYLDATAMCAKEGRLWSNYVKSAQTQSFLDSLEASTGECALVQQHTGGNGERHTWIHPSVCAHLKQWLEKPKATPTQPPRVYAVTSPVIGIVKVGKWCGSLQNLKTRYITVYGPEVSIARRLRPGRTRPTLHVWGIRSWWRAV